MSIIFEKYIQKQSTSDHIFVKLTVDEDINISYVKPVSIQILEAFGLSSPVVTIQFIDGVGDFFNHIKLDTGMTFTLDIGTSQNVVSFDMKAIKIRHVNNLAGKATNISIEVQFVHVGWHEMLNLSHNRSWSAIKYSSLVEELANECNFKKVEVEESKKTIPSIIQPYWNNLALIRWCQERAVRDRPEESHYEFGVTTEGTFLFKSLADFYDEAPPVIIYRLEGQPDRDSDRSSLRSENEENSAYFIQFEQKESYMDHTIHGAGGVEGMYYDWMTRQFVRTPVKFSDMNQPQLCDWSLLKTDNEHGSLRMYAGRDRDVGDRARHTVSYEMNAMHNFSIRVDGTPFVHIGDLIELIIPVPPDYSNKMYNEIYSGFYMCTEVQQNIMLFDNGNTNYTNKLILSRCGIDGKDGQEITQLVKSSKGKI